MAAAANPTGRPKLHRRLAAERIARESPILRGWMAICAYLNTTETTAKDWLRRYDLPVYKTAQRATRHNSSVTAYKAELDEWHRNFTVGKALTRDEDAHALPALQRLRLYRLEVQRALVHAHRAKLALARRKSPEEALKQLCDTVRILNAANLKFIN